MAGLVRDVLISVGASVVASALISFSFRLVVGDPLVPVVNRLDVSTGALVDTIRRTVIVLNEAREAGLMEVFSRRSDVPSETWKNLFARARSRIDVLVYAGAFLFEHPDFGNAVKTVLSAGGSVRILFGDPDGAAVRMRTAEEKTEGSIVDRVRTSLSRVDALGATNIEVRFHDTSLYASVYRFDDRMVVTPQLFGVRAALAPALVLAQVSGGLFDSYAAHFESVWALAAARSPAE